MGMSRSILWCTHADLGNQGATTRRYYITHGQTWVNDTYIDTHNYSARGAIVMINVGLFQACLQQYCTSKLLHTRGNVILIIVQFTVHNVFTHSNSNYGNLSKDSLLAIPVFVEY